MDACETVQMLDDELLVTEQNWTKNSRLTYTEDHEPQMCLIGALSAACIGNALKIPEGSAKRVYDEVKAAMCQAIDGIETEPWFGHLGAVASAKVVAFNDDPDTTFDNVKQVLRRTREILCN